MISADGNEAAAKDPRPVHASAVDREALEVAATVPPLRVGESKAPEGNGPGRAIVVELVKDGGAADKLGRVGEYIEGAIKVGKGVDSAESQEPAKDGETDESSEGTEDLAGVDTVLECVAEDGGENGEPRDVLSVDAEKPEPSKDVRCRLGE